MGKNKFCFFFKINEWISKNSTQIKNHDGYLSSGHNFRVKVVFFFFFCIFFLIFIEIKEIINIYTHFSQVFKIPIVLIEKYSLFLFFFFLEKEFWVLIIRN